MVTTGRTIGTLNIYDGMGYGLSQATQVVEHDGLDLMSTKQTIWTEACCNNRWSTAWGALRCTHHAPVEHRNAWGSGFETGPTGGGAIPHTSTGQMWRASRSGGRCQIWNQCEGWQQCRMRCWWWCWFWGWNCQWITLASMTNIRWVILLGPLMVWLMKKNCGFIARKSLEEKDGYGDGRIRMWSVKLKSIRRSGFNLT